MIHRFLISILLCSLTGFARAGDPFAENIRTTPPLSPQDELKSFHIPPGFEIQLVASEPDIAKPLNMAFDSPGRLWITQTREYPFPAKDKGRDAIKIIEIGPDGVASKISTFADSLDIPIGIYPYQGGAIAHSIPKIWHFHDDNNDGKADRIEPLFGGEIGTNDTHGMVNGFRRGFDGWLYSAHNFNNTSTIIASDGSSITLNSGNTFRMKIDGGRVEQFTWGQTNPFGLCFDPLGNLYSADSHSKPIYQLLRGGYYEGIGKTDDGLGFTCTAQPRLAGSSTTRPSNFRRSSATTSSSATSSRAGSTAIR